MDGAILVIVNADAGGMTGANDTTPLGAGFLGRGMTPQIARVGRGEIDGAMRQLLPSAPPLVVAAGGDGTVSAVAAHLVGSGIPLAILPFGTLNHFARTLGIPLDLDAAIDVIARGETRAVDVGEANGWTFLNNASLGLYATIVRDRERERRRLGLGKWPALARATLHALRDPSAFSVTLALSGETLERRTPFLFVGNNRYAYTGFRIGSRECLDEGVLSVCVLRPKHAAGFLWLALRALVGGAGEGSDFETFEVDSLQVEGHGAAMELAFDGEVRRVDGPLRFRVRPRALRVIAPPGGGRGAR